MIGLPEEQKKTMRLMLIMSPVMILFVSMSAPAGLGLYFFVGGLFACLQTLIINFFRPRIRREVEQNSKAPHQKHQHRRNQSRLMQLNPSLVILVRKIMRGVVGMPVNNNDTVNNH
ncbi:Membrane protein insertase YidC [Lactiplantibacillus plantarum subsp. plantarum]|uniref:Membrane protein insertase YidC n=1 Tax=Lactiplantibacillus plantarum subsp. plantarum TaxID=337330 RepID=A0A2S3U9B7_LACPN|nr:Membrane protein insertase YidC [Lactiplantibacillus plantarum subsp. plantarum]